MKQFFTLISILVVGIAAQSQVIFQSDLSSWTAGAPDGWMGSKTNIGGANVIEVPMGSTYGASDAQLVNATTSHKRFTTQTLSVTNGQSYEIKFWAKGQGEIRTGLFDDHTPTSSFGYLYNSYIDVNSVTPVEYTQTITALNTNASAEFILSVVNTVGPAHIVIDSVSISAVVIVPTTVSIYDIQYTTSSPADSPYDGQIVTTSGIVTAIIQNGPDAGAYFLQDGSGAYNGIYIYDTDAIVAIGDSVTLTGEVDEYFTLTEIKNVTSYTVETTGNALPASVNLTTANATQEQYEGVLITATSAECTNNAEGFGLWAINDGSGVVKCDDDIFPFHLDAVIGNWYMVTGIGHYSFSEAKILPRSAADIVLTGTASVEENGFEISVYPNPSNAFVQLNVNASDLVTIYNVNGSVVFSGIGTKTVDVSNFEAGVYIVQVISENTNNSVRLVVE